MAIRHSVWVRDHVRGLSITDRAVLLTLASACDDENNQCFPSVTTLEQQTELSRRTVFDSLARLEEAKLIVRLKTSGKETTYELQIPARATDAHSRTSAYSRTSEPSRTSAVGRDALVRPAALTSAPSRTHKGFKEVKGGDTDPDAGLAVAVGAAQKPKRQKPKDEYTRQSATWVEPETAQEAPSDQAARMEAIDLWRRVQAQLKLDLPAGTFDQWVQRAYGVRLGDGELVIAGTNMLQVDMLKNRLRPTIERAIRTCSGRQIALGVVQPGH